MRIFLYEHLVARGWRQLGLAREQGESLLREGAAMLTCAARDFARIPGVAVHVARSRESASLDFVGCEVHELGDSDGVESAITSLAEAADWTIVIAPETGGTLADVCRRLRASGARLLMPSEELIALASDKHLTAKWLAAAGVRTPPGRALEPGSRLPADFHYPAVLKPRDGAGSDGVRLIRSARDSAAIVRPSRLEAYCPGLAVGVSLLCGPNQTVVLPCCEQSLSQDGSFTYLGGRLPVAADLDRRAAHLAGQVAKALPRGLGYIGIDIVLGTEADGSQDFVIEINPRLTTSYVGLSAALDANLAQLMLVLSASDPVDSVNCDREVKFRSDGAVHLLSVAGGT